MARKKGQILALRPRIIKSRSGEVRAFQLAYIPVGDEYEFPSVINVVDDLVDTFDSLRGQTVEFVAVETPPFGDLLVTQVVSAAV